MTDNGSLRATCCFSPLPVLGCMGVMRFERAQTKTSGGQDEWIWGLRRLCLLGYGISEHHWTCNGRGSGPRQIGKNNTYGTAKKGVMSGIGMGASFLLFLGTNKQHIQIEFYMEVQSHDKLIQMRLHFPPTASSFRCNRYLDR